MSAHAQAARRPARSRGRGRSRSRGGINWERFGRVALVVVLFAVLASYLNPVVNFIHAWSDSKSTKQHLVELRQENLQLQRQAASDSSDAVLVREARRLGMVRPGERAWAIKHLPH
jgi:cell division protein FtsB